MGLLKVHQVKYMLAEQGPSDFPNIYGWNSLQEFFENMWEEFGRLK